MKGLFENLTIIAIQERTSGKGNKYQIASFMNNGYINTMMVAQEVKAKVGVPAIAEIEISFYQGKMNGKITNLTY